MDYRNLDIPAKGPEKAPAESAVEMARKKLEQEKAKIPNSPTIKWETKDALLFLKTWLQTFLLAIVGKQKIGFWEWATGVIVILGVIAILLMVLFPKLHLL